MGQDKASDNCAGLFVVCYLIPGNTGPVQEQYLVKPKGRRRLSHHVQFQLHGHRRVKSSPTCALLRSIRPNRASRLRQRSRQAVFSQASMRQVWHRKAIGLHFHQHQRSGNAGAIENLSTTIQFGSMCSVFENSGAASIGQSVFSRPHTARFIQAKSGITRGCRRLVLRAPCGRARPSA